MSTIPEVIAASHMGLKVLAISCVTNMAAGILDQAISHEEVFKTADRVKEDFAALLGRCCRRSQPTSKRPQNKKGRPFGRPSLVIIQTRGLAGNSFAESATTCWMNGDGIRGANASHVVPSRAGRQ